MFEFTCLRHTVGAMVIPAEGCDAIVNMTFLPFSLDVRVCCVCMVSRNKRMSKCSSDIFALMTDANNAKATHPYAQTDTHTHTRIDSSFYSEFVCPDRMLDYSI